MKIKITFGHISTACCMIAAFWLAIIGEWFLAPLCWVVYTIGGVTGIIHLKRRKDRSTMLMFVIWTILDILAIARLMING